ncbi:MAG: hypothetical protein HFI37_02700 [Lachnospiraceae bacterium]|nr:hypothetical protein [Lachnospiraceae bacterium]
MLKKSKDLLTNNIGLKFLSVIFALILWLVVVNIDDPDKTRTFSTSVTLVNEDAVANMGKSYEIINDSNVVSFRVTAKRSIIERMGTTDFKATADMENIELKKDGTAVVPIDINSSRYSSQIDIDRKNKNLEIAIEDLQSNQFKVIAQTQGEPAEGSAVGEVTVSPNVITVSGPMSVVGRISRITATIDVNGAFADTEDNVVPVPYDASGNPLDTSKLTFSQELVSIKAQILTVKEIPISCETGGELADDYQQVDVKWNPERITVKGTAEQLNKITVITIPKEALDISGAKETLKKEIDISTYLPEGVTLVDSSQAKIEVTIVIEQMESRTFQVPVGNIKIFNLSDKYDIEYQGKRIPVTLKGYASDIENLSAKDIMLSIDLSGVQPGTNEVVLSLNLENKYELLENSTITINLIDKNAKEESRENDVEDEE